MIRRKFGQSANAWNRSLILANINERIYGKITKGGSVYKKFADELTKRQSWQAIFERYLKAYGPATLDDFAHWTGINKTILKRQITVNHINCYRDNKIYYYCERENSKVEYPIQTRLSGGFD